jgi:probable HAF family extracellular repeat protein
MKSRILTCTTAMTLFAALAIPVRMAAEHHARYKLIDMGTFGGPASYVNAPINGVPALTGQGTTVGTSATSIPAPANINPFGCLGPDGTVPFIFHAFEWQNGVVTDLGALPPQHEDCSIAQAVNPRGGIVAGSSGNGVVDPLIGLTEIRAILWKDGEIIDLGTLGGNHSAAFAIDDRGQAAGFALNAIPDPFSIFYFQAFGSSSGTQTRAFLWQNGQMQDLGTLGGNDAFASYLNERGQVAGVSYTNSTPNPVTGIPTQDPFLWENGTMLDLGSLGGTSASPTALNNRGQVIGVSSLAGDQIFDPFLWDEGKLIDLNTHTIGGNPITANALNDAGEIVGGGSFPNRVFDAYVWRNGAATDLGTLNSDCFSEAVAINSRSQVVGYSLSCDGSTLRSFLWERGSMIDLNTLIPPNSGLQLAETIAINDRGEIAGNGVPPSCKSVATCGHAFVLIPAGEDEAEGATALSQNNPGSIDHSPTTVTQGSPAAIEMMARIHARLARRYRGFGVSPRK